MFALTGVTALGLPRFAFGGRGRLRTAPSAFFLRGILGPGSAELRAPCAALRPRVLFWLKSLCLLAVCFVLGVGVV